MLYVFAKTSFKIWISFLKEIYFFPSRLCPISRSLRGKFLKKKKNQRRDRLYSILFSSSKIRLVRVRVEGKHVEIDRARACIIAHSCMLLRFVIRYGNGARDISISCDIKYRATAFTAHILRSSCIRWIARSFFFFFYSFD